MPEEQKKGIYAKDKKEAKYRADKIAKKEGIEGELELTEKPDITGGIFFSALWRKK
jgi:isopentenyl phosphate kinase